MINLPDEKKRSLTGGVKILLVINCVFILMMVIRAFLCIAIMDEVFNVGQAYRIIQGNVFLVENWEYFQTGDSFLFPFLYVFYKITGSSDGIILFSRIVFIILQFLLSIFIYKILSRYFGRLSSFFAVLVYESAVQFLLFYMWYDNWEVFFRLIGLFLIVFVYCSYNRISRKKSYALVFLAGIAHACMVFAYPTMIIVYIFVLGLLFFFKRKESAKVHNLWATSYVLGALAVFLVFLVYAFKIGIHNIFVFNETISSVGLGSVGRDSYFTLSGIFERTKELIVDNFKCYLFGIVIYIVDILSLVLLRKSKKRKFVFCSIMFIGCLVQMVDGLVNCEGINFLAAYITFYAFPLYFLLDKKADNYNNIRILMYVLFASSYVAGFAYNYTALYGSLKFACGARPGVVVVILLLFELFKHSESKQYVFFSFSMFATLLVTLNLFFMYFNSFEGIRPYKCDTLIRSGIFKGLFDTSETADRYESVQRDLLEFCGENDRTITCGPYAIEFYLMTDLKPDTCNLWDSKSSDLLFKYYDSYYGEPDIIILHDSADEDTDTAFLDFVRTNYYLVKHSNGYLIYHRSE